MLNSEKYVIILTKDNKPFFTDSIGEYWRAYIFIEDSISYDTVEKPEDFYQSAVSFGEFQGMLADFDASKLHETIPDFHDTNKRYKKLIEDNIYKISDIPSDTFKEFNAKGKRLNVYNQIRYQKGEIKEKYLIDMEKVKEILKNDYINENINWLIFFDFESFQHCIPLVKDSTPWRQVVSQYSMHIVRSDYDLSKHNFESGRGGQIYHYEFVHMLLFHLE